MGSETIRNIKGRKYLYYIFYDDKVRKEVFCGPAADGGSSDRLRNAKIDDLKGQKAQITSKIRELQATGIDGKIQFNVVKNRAGVKKQRKE